MNYAMLSVQRKYPFERFFSLLGLFEHSTTILPDQNSPMLLNPFLVQFILSFSPVVCGKGFNLHTVLGFSQDSVPSSPTIRMAGFVHVEYTTV